MELYTDTRIEGGVGVLKCIKKLERKQILSSEICLFNYFLVIKKRDASPSGTIKACSACASLTNIVAQFFRKSTKTIEIWV